MPRYRQITCLSEAGIEKRDVVIPTDTRFDVAAGATKRLCDIEGPGRIVRFWITLPVFGRGPVLRNAVLRIFWDGELKPSVECPLGDFFGAAFAKPRRFVSDGLTVAGGGYVCRFEMPFRKRAIIEVENQGARPLRLLVFQVGYYEDEVVPDRVETFHSQWRRENPTVEGEPFTAAQIRGRGRLVGLKLDMQNRSWWLSPNIKKMFFPRGLGLGMLEGPERITVDDEKKPSIVGTGAEDFFQGGWYFKGGPFVTPTHGVTVRSYLKGRVSAYRIMLRDPIPFEKSLKLTFDHGASNEVKTDYASTTYWYQTEPHADFPKLLPAPERRPSSVAGNIIQPLIALGAIGVFVGAVICSVLAWV